MLGGCDKDFGDTIKEEWNFMRLPLRNTIYVCSAQGPILGLALGLALALGGCTEAIVGAGATAGVAVAQERSVGAAIDDTTIQLDINRRLFEKDEKLFTKINLEVVEGRVLMTGVVPKPDDKVEAVRLAWTAPGVKEVINEIQVQDKTSLTDFASDAWITTRLRATMLTDRDVSDINYSVETVNGTIYLMGIARNRAELDRVTNHARNIPGVKQVKSFVRLKDDPRRRGS
jgi:osmotically-inducible protein OsmY